jgi:hypothetical protein
MLLMNYTSYFYLLSLLLNYSECPLNCVSSIDVVSVKLRIVCHQGQKNRVDLAQSGSRL